MIGWQDDFALEDYSGTDWSIWIELRDLVDHWYNTYRHYWGVQGEPRPDGVNDEAWAYRKFLDGLAPKILKIAVALHSGANAPPGARPTALSADYLRDLRKILREESKSPLIRDRVSLELAQTAIEQLKGAHERALRLVGLIHGKELSDRASSYVQRATTLYIWGFEPEAAVMCRSSLEAALSDRLAEWIDPDGRAPNLDELLQIAGRQGVLAGYEASRANSTKWRARRESPLWRAQRIKWAGNYAVHDRPQFRQEEHDLPDAFQTIRELSLVLRELFPLPARNEGSHV